MASNISTSLPVQYCGNEKSVLNDDDAMDIEDESNDPFVNSVQSDILQHGPMNDSNDNSSTMSSYFEAAKAYLSELNWTPYPPLLQERKATNVGVDDESQDVDISKGLVFSDSKKKSDTGGLGLPGRDVPSPLLQASFDYKEFIFTYLQKFASSRRSFIGPLTEKAASELAKFTDKMIDSALSQDDITVRKAIDQLLGTVESSDIVVGELLDERKWDIAEEAVEECLDFLTSKVAQHVDFYADAPEAARADPVFSMILAETDWLLYEMVSYVADEPVDKQLYDDHFYGPSEEEKLKRKQLELQMKKKLKEKRQQSFYPAISSAFLQPTNTEQSFAPPPDLEGLDPNTAAYWQAYQDCQQQAAFLQQAAYSYSAKQHAQYIFSQAQASTSAYNSYINTQTQAQTAISSSNPPQNKPKSLAAKFIQSALNAKKAAMGNSSPKAVGPSIASPKQPEPKVNSPKPDETKRIDKSRNREDSSRKRDRDEGDRDEKLPGPIYCMVTNLRYDTRASDVDRPASRYGRVDSIKVLKDKTAKPPENGLASITFCYVYKSSFERLLSNGLRVDGKYRPIAKLQSDPFGTS